MSKIVTAWISPIKAGDLRIKIATPEPNMRLWYPTRMTEKELLDFVIAVVERRVLIGHHVQPFADLSNVFPALASLADMSIDARKQIGCCYEYLDRANGQTLHKNPHFETVRYVHAEDWRRARELIAAEVVRRQST